MSLSALLIVVAFICFVAEALGVKTRVSLGWLGLAFFALASLV